MTTPIPTSTSVTESAIISAPLAQVWHLIKLQSFHRFWSALKTASYIKEPATSPETDIVKWEFKDGTVQDVKQEEHSAINHFITYSVIASTPALTYSSVISTIRCYAVTSGEQEGSTFVTWSGNFSRVIEDARFKRTEALADLAAAVKKEFKQFCIADQRSRRISLSLAAPPKFPEHYRWRIPRSTQFLDFSGWGDELPIFDDVIALIERVQLQLHAEISTDHTDRAMQKIKTWTDGTASLVLVNEKDTDGMSHREAIRFLEGLRLSGEVFGGQAQLSIAGSRSKEQAVAQTA
ncbi:MAG: hypothetical protein Q9201_000849 [Fulgogasparrea decipioides]